MKVLQPFYRFRDNSSYNPAFTWAISIHPRSEMIDWECSECGATEYYPSGAFDVTVEEGDSYPDVLGCGAYPFLIVSEIVASAWANEGITQFHTYPVRVAEIKSEKLSGVEPLQYFRVEIDGRCQIDLNASGVRIIQQCPTCRRLIKYEPNPISRFHMGLDSWDGSDVFRDTELFPQVNFCTERISQLVNKYKLTNFRFEPTSIVV